NAPTRQRDISHPNFVFKLELDAKQSKTFYIHTRSPGTARLPMRLWQPQAFNEYYFTNFYLVGISYGMMFMMLIYSLFIFFTTRDLTYIYYIGLVAAYIGIQGSIDGLLMWYVSPNVLITPLIVDMFMIFMSLFTQQLLDTKQHAPRLHKALYAPMILAVINGLLFFAIFEKWTGLVGAMHQVGLLSTWSLTIIVAIRCYLLKVKAAGYFLMAWTAPFCLFVLGILLTTNILSSIFSAVISIRELFYLTSIMIVLLLALAMSGRISAMRAAALYAQQTALEEVQSKQLVAEQNAQLQAENFEMGAELDVTHHLQQMVLPNQAELEAIDELDIAGFMKPAKEVGGDYYDVLRYSDKTLICIGDVTGHGLASGVLMLMVQTTVRTLAVSNTHTHREFFRVLNRTIYDSTQRMDADKNMTLLMLDYQAGTLSLSGQHEEVLVVRNNGSIERIDTLELGFMLGIEPNIDQFFNSREIKLSPGDGIVLYTDGITEAFHPNKGLYGVERLCQVIEQHWHAPAKSIQQAVIQDLNKFAEDVAFMDDITLLVLKECTSKEGEKSSGTLVV
ncbi:MAG: SpoIIE family protein phosphatase, partial [Pseudomonadota bacterium]